MSEIEETKTEETPKPLKGEVTEEQLELLKQQYPKLKKIIFEYGDIIEEGEKAIVYVKPFTIPLYEAALQIEKSKSTIKLAEWILKNLRVAGMGTDEILNDIDWLKNFAAVAQALTYVKYGEIKKN